MNDLELVLIEIGRCPTCGGGCKTADGLKYHSCARGHASVSYELVDTYAMDARKTWED